MNGLEVYLSSIFQHANCAVNSGVERRVLRPCVAVRASSAWLYPHWHPPRFWCNSLRIIFHRGALGFLRAMAVVKRHGPSSRAG